MKIDLSNPPYAVKLKELGFAYSYTDCEKGVIVYTHASPRLVGSPWIDCWDDMECIIDFEDENCMKPFSFTFKYYDYFGLPNILEALGKWDKQYGMDNETTGR